MDLSNGDRKILVAGAVITMPAVSVLDIGSKHNILPFGCYIFSKGGSSQERVYLHTEVYYEGIPLTRADIKKIIGDLARNEGILRSSEQDKQDISVGKLRPLKIGEFKLPSGVAYKIVQGAKPRKPEGNPHGSKHLEWTIDQLKKRLEDETRKRSGANQLGITYIREKDSAQIICEVWKEKGMLTEEVQCEYIPLKNKGDKPNEQSKI